MIMGNVNEEEKSAVIFGAAKPGIGQAVTDLLLSHGTKVIGVTGTADLAETAEYRTGNPAVLWIEVDNFAPETVISALADIKGVSSVIHADFYFYMESHISFDLAEWTRSLHANLSIPKVVGHLASTVWSETCRSVVFVTSSESNTGSFGAHAYAATKAAVHNLTKSLANSAEGSTRYNSVAAGWIGGVMDTDEVFNLSRQITPLHRLGRPEEVAAAAYWLSNEDSSFVNGATLFVDGGYTGVDTISKYEYKQEYHGD